MANGRDGARGTYGSGGGAGGTIAIQSRSLQGTSVIAADGGAGSEGGGGGGAGGRLVIQFADNYKFDAQPAQSHYWRGTHSIEGGSAGLIETEKGYAKGS